MTLVLMSAVWWFLFGFAVGWLWARDRWLRLAAKYDQLATEVTALRARVQIAEKDQC
jgi:hypothetical protein